MTIKELLNEGYLMLKKNNIEEASLKARILLSNILECSKEKLIFNYNDNISNENKKTFMDAIEKIILGVPIQYITHKQEFMKLEFYVDENVLIPRADTEILVEEVIDIANKINKSSITILDMCTGSGAIVISLAKYLDNNNKYKALDLSKLALNIAQKNSISNNVDEKIKFIESDMFNNLNKDEKFNIIVSNPPYIDPRVIEKLSNEVKNEPYIALDGGKNGLDFYRIIAENAYKYLKKDGYVCVEIGYDQKDAVMQLFKDNEYSEIYCKKDLYSNDRIVIAKK